MSTLEAAEEEATNQSPEIIQDSNPKMSKADLLSKWISQELDLMTSKDVSPEAAKDRIDQLYVQINQARTKFNELQTRNGPSSSSSTSIAAGNGDPELERDLQLLNKEVSLLKSMFPFSLFKKPITTDPNINWRDRSTPHFVSTAPDKLLHNLITSDYFNRTPTLQELEESLQGINSEMRWVLVCFLVFPQNSIMKKSLLLCWAELSAPGDEGTQQIHDDEGTQQIYDYEGTPQIHDDEGTRLIQDLITKGLIHPVYKDTLTVGGYWMHPFVRSTLSDHNCLQLQDSRDKVYVTDNSSEDIFYDDPTPFLAKRELRILHLGNWQRSSVRHIEVEDPNSFFKDMAKLSHLRYVSLRGVSLVTEMPKFITKLRLLETLDLKSCHNLEVLPSSIGNLASSLTHLDMSECYFLEDMPMALSELRSLKVLKGFVVPEDNKENSCTLEDLLSLQKLVKLNIYTNVRSFPKKDDLKTLRLFTSLHSLTISWGGCSLPKKETGNSGAIAAEHRRRKELYKNALKSHKDPCLLPLDSMELYKNKSYYRPVIFDRLGKLDLQCVPATVTHEWLNPKNFRWLKKLYIRGGNFCDLGQAFTEEEYCSRRERFLQNDCSPDSVFMEDYQWSVEILRLKHLENLEMDFEELVFLFPKLICLENVKCPRLKNFPCNDGVWMDTVKLKKYTSNPLQVLDGPGEIHEQ